MMNKNDFLISGLSGWIVVPYSKVRKAGKWSLFSFHRDRCLIEPEEKKLNN